MGDSAKSKGRAASKTKAAVPKPWERKKAPAGQAADGQAADGKAVNGQSSEVSKAGEGAAMAGGGAAEGSAGDTSTSASGDGGDVAATDSTDLAKESMLKKMSEAEEQSREEVRNGVFHS